MSPEIRPELLLSPEDYSRLHAALSSGQHPVTKLKDGSGVILHLSGMQVLALNETGMFLVEQVRQGTAHADLAASLVGQFEVTPAAAEADVNAFLGSLIEAFRG